MEVDTTAQTAGQTVLAAEKGMDAMINELGEVLAQLEDQPENVPLLRRQIHLMQQLGMASEAIDCVLRLSTLVMLSEDIWLNYFDGLIQSFPQPLTLEPFVEILERFDQAERDYLSAAILLRHLEFILLCARSALPLLATTSEQPNTPYEVDPEVVDFLSPDSARSMIRSVEERGRGLLSENHLLWQPLLHWEMSLLQSLTGDARLEQIDRIHDMFAERMSTPHSSLDVTSSLYSTFCSEYCPEEYEARLVQATEASQTAKTKLSMEKRYGRRREDFEQELAFSTDPSSQIQIFVSYISWETDLRAKNPKNAGKTPSLDPLLIHAVFERAIAIHARAAGAADATIMSVSDAIKAAEASGKKPGRKGKGKMKAVEDDADVTDLATLRQQLRLAEETVRAYKEGEAGIWATYASWAEDAGSTEEVGDVRVRATRSCPQNASTWCRLLNSIELAGRSLEELNATFETSLALGLLTIAGGPINGLTELFVWRAAFESRTEPVERVTGDYHPVMMSIMRGMEMATKINKAGDTSLRLEKFLLDWAETRAPHLLEQAILVLDKPSKARAASYQMVLLRTGVETRRGNVDGARQAFVTAIQRSDLDWPEAVYEAFIQLENVHGDLAGLVTATKLVEKEQEKVTRRREKAAQEQSEQYQLAIPAPINPEAAVPTDSAPDNRPVDDASGIPVPVSVNSGVDDGGSHNARDREHTTVLVNGFAKGADATRMDAFFAECGPIRETVLLSNAEQATNAALVEFRQVEAVPAALLRDHKKLDGREVSVSMLWRSSLFVTNFAREIDDAALRQMFSQYGSILQIRWPSRKYAADRRFCYITMDSPASAQNALVLNGMKMDGGFGLSVAISDPAAKTQRTDAAAAKTTLFVGGLTAKTKQQDVEELIRPHGTIRSVKLGWDPLKRICKGFAFVDMVSEADAQACLKLHGTQLNGRFLKLEISDPNHANKKSSHTHSAIGARQAADKRARTVRLHNLPESTQEGLLQQALEKVIPVKRLEMFLSSREAIAELESQADAGLLVLRPEPFIFEGVTIEFTAQGRRGPPPPVRGSDAQPPRSSSLSFAPRVARKPGIGKGRQAPLIDKALPAVLASSSSQNAGTRSQDDFRAVVALKNKQREGNLANATVARSAEIGEKRPNENGEDHQVKRAKVEEAVE